VSAVGSWFFISVTNNVRKSLAEMVAESLLVLPELLVAFAVELEPFAAATGVAMVPVRDCTAVIV
jgi:hypothetical protein